MVYKNFICIGKVVFIALGPYAGKLAAVVNVIDQNRLLIDGPCSGVPRSVISLKHVNLTDFSIKIPFGSRTGTVKTAWEKADVVSKWNETPWAKKIAAKERKSQMTDFDRFCVRKLKKRREVIIRKEMGKLRKAAK